MGKPWRKPQEDVDWRYYRRLLRRHCSPVPPTGYGEIKVTGVWPNLSARPKFDDANPRHGQEASIHQRAAG